MLYVSNMLKRSIQVKIFLFNDLIIHRNSERISFTQKPKYDSDATLNISFQSQEELLHQTKHLVLENKWFSQLWSKEKCRNVIMSKSNKVENKNGTSVEMLDAFKLQHMIVRNFNALTLSRTFSPSLLFLFSTFSFFGIFMFRHFYFRPKLGLPNKYSNRVSVTVDDRQQLNRLNHDEGKSKKRCGKVKHRNYEIVNESIKNYPTKEHSNKTYRKER